jgi:hypothetical protein
MEMSGRPNTTQATVMAESAPAAPAKVVLSAMSAVTGTAPRVEPGLNPYQPSQRMKVPSTNR